MQEKGTISVSTENIFPIIKKFLYSDQEIFLREIVSNGVDAIQKLKKLAALGEFEGELGELKVEVSFNKDAKTITVSDNGIGMTAEEVKKYINQVAFSGATEFLEKYKDKTDTKEIIGHFGLGFYSAFMVSEKVSLTTLSYKSGAEPVLWTCNGTTEFEIQPTVKKERGTTVVMHIAEDATEFLDSYRIRKILEKYARFLPIPIFFEGKQINETQPIWTKAPTDLKDEDYLAFYKSLYPMAEDPLFWIHLNVDYPFNLTGVLYFPKVRNNFDLYREKIQLYSRQVFITDEVKSIVPEFLLLLHGVIDSPDIPLNVSRSYLQSDANVKKINTYITKKVAEKLHEIFTENRESFEKKWESLGIFVKYGIITDEKFYEKAKEFCLVRNTENKFFTLEEYKKHIQATQTDKNGNLVWLYTSDAAKQDAFIQAAKRKGYDVLQFDDFIIDNHFIQSLERRLEKTILRRVDSETADKIIDTGVELASVLTKEQEEKLKALFEKVLADRKVTIQVQSLSPDDMPVIVTLPEYMRRMYEMAATSGGMQFLKDIENQLTVSVNANHSLIAKILETTDEALQTKYIRHTFDLAMLSQNRLGNKNLTEFIYRSIELLQK
ncbi:MAG: molecular chaperone HtpG [Microscillaceae bacterium]|nr:molecular chaperone HtpG [Microscillaceae bacterium]MDW8461113.1 molecular chaperone HtpG [Cytophagales bacterium]